MITSREDGNFIEVSNNNDEIPNQVGYYNVHYILKEILEVGIPIFFGIWNFRISLKKNGGLAQLARAPALHAGGHRFDSDILHNSLDIRIDRL
jgi:hypothetical protein